MGLRVFTFLILLFAGFTAPVWLFVPLLAVYIFIYTGIEVLFITLCIDAYFGYGSEYPFMYTLCCGVALVAVYSLRPALSIYNR